MMENRFLKYFAITVLIFMIINLILLVPSSIISSHHRQILSQKVQVENRIENIKKLQVENQRLSEEKNRMIEFNVQKTALGRSLYLLSECIPEDVWLEKLYYGDSYHGFNRTINKGLESKLYLEGIAKTESSIMTFVESLKSETTFMYVSLVRYERASHKSSPAVKQESAGIQFLISMIIVK